MYIGLLSQQATYWEAQSPDGHDIPVSGPVAVSCRWQDSVERLVDSGGEEFVSRAVVYLQTAPTLDSWLLLGTSVLADPVDAGAVRVRIVGKTQNQAGGIVVHKAVCG